MKPKIKIALGDSSKGYVPLCEVGLGVAHCESVRHGLDF